MKTINVQGQDGIIDRRAYGTFRYHGWPTLVKLTDGTLAVAVSACRIGHVCPFGKDLLFLSKDEGKTWSNPIIVNDTWLDDRDTGLCALPNGGLLISWFNADYTLLDVRDEALRRDYSKGEMGLIDAYRETAIQVEEQHPGAYTRVSHDGGLTWGEATQVQVGTPHGPTMMNDGSLLYFAKLSSRDENNRVLDPAERHIVAMRSTDEGKTWTELGRPPMPEGQTCMKFTEADGLQLPSGRIVGAMRWQDIGSPDFGGLSIYTTYSDDGGKTWAVPKPSGNWGAPPHLLYHSSGALLCSYGCRTEGRFSERVMVSYDEGETWELDICINDKSPVWDLGYPSTVELSDGSLLTAYYQRYVDENGVADDKTSLLYTKWTLPERE